MGVNVSVWYHGTGSKVEVSMTERPLVSPASPNNADLTRGRPFEKGNTAGRGRPEGSRNKATLLLDKLADAEAEAIQRQVIEAAKGGDLKAAELILARIWPPRRGRPVRLELPPVRTAAEVSDGMAAVVERHGRRRGHARGGGDHLRGAGGAAQGAGDTGARRPHRTPGAGDEVTMSQALERRVARLEESVGPPATGGSSATIRETCRTGRWIWRCEKKPTSF